MNIVKIDTIDLIIIIVYIIGILFIGLWSVRKNKMTSENYFLAGRGLKWLIVGAALFASNISTIHMVGLAASGYNDGLVWGNFEWMAVFTLILLGLIFAPFYIKTRAASTGLTWYAVFLGYPVMGIWYWCTDQTHVQRVLGARTLDDAQKGSLFAGVLKILPVFILVLPGIIGYVLFKDLIGPDANQTFPVLIKQLLPIGLKGIVSAALLAALMSVLAAALNSSATLVSVDIVKRLRPSTTDKDQVLIGRIAAVLIMIAAMLWSTQGGKFHLID